MSDQSKPAASVGPTKVQRRRHNEEQIQASLKNLLTHLHLDPESEGLQDTPRRIKDFLLEFCQGNEDISDILNTDFSSPDGHGMVIQTNIPFRMLCEHHFMPAFGMAAVGYIPRDTVVGLSKITRLVQAAGTVKPNLQETVTNSIAEAIVDKLRPQGVMVVIEAEHTCMTVRGINAPGVGTITSSVNGVFRDVAQARSEFLSLIQGRRS